MTRFLLLYNKILTTWPSSRLINTIFLVLIFHERNFTYFVLFGDDSLDNLTDVILLINKQLKDNKTQAKLDE